MTLFLLQQVLQMANFLKEFNLKVANGYATTHSIVMRAKSGTVRFIEGRHSLAKKPHLVIKE